MSHWSIRQILVIPLLLVSFLVGMPIGGGWPDEDVYFLPLISYPEEPAPDPMPLLCSPSDAVVALDMECSQIDAPGNDHQNLGEEYVCFRGRAALPTQLDGWMVFDLHPRYHTYRFGEFRLERGATLRLNSGAGIDAADHLYWGYHHAIWNNGGDTVCLYDADGILVQACDYGRAIEAGVSPEAHCEGVR